MDALIADELARIEQEGLYVPSQQWTGEGVPELVWDKGPVEIERVQRFWPTAPAEGQPGGSPCETAPAHIYADNADSDSSCVVHEPSNRGILRVAGHTEQDQPGALIGSGATS